MSKTIDIAARTGFYVFLGVCGLIATVIAAAVIVLPFFGIYEPLVGAFFAAVLGFALWGFLKVIE